MSKYLDVIGKQISQKKGSPNVDPSPVGAIGAITGKVKEGLPYVVGTLAAVGIGSVVWNKVKAPKENYPLNKENNPPFEIEEQEDSFMMDQDATVPYSFLNSNEEDTVDLSDESIPEHTEISDFRLQDVPAQQQETEIIGLDDYDETEVIETPEQDEFGMFLNGLEDEPKKEDEEEFDLFEQTATMEVPNYGSGNDDFQVDNNFSDEFGDVSDFGNMTESGFQG